MSTVVENRVVEMEFNNEHFEKGVKSTIESLENLERALQLDGAEDGFEKVSAAANAVQLGRIEDDLDQVTDKFTLLGQIGYQVLERISSKVVDLGFNMAKSLSVDQISAGMSKFERQNIALAALESALPTTSTEKIKSVLAELQDYTDETSYDYAGMIEMIQRFVNSGVDLDVAVAAMKGIGNEAAKAGASIQQGMAGMSAFSKSLGRGYVMQQEWQSIETATMATKEFKEELIKTAIAMGQLGRNGTIQKTVGSGSKKQIKTITVDYQTFNETLKEGWLTSEVLTSTLARYSDRTTDFGNEAYLAAQQARTLSQAIDAVKDAASSGWMTSFGHIFGDLKTSTAMFTDIANGLIEVVDGSAEIRNDWLSEWRKAMTDQFNQMTGANQAEASWLYTVLKDSEGNYILDEDGEKQTVGVLVELLQTLNDIAEVARNAVWNVIMPFGNDGLVDAGLTSQALADICLNILDVTHAFNEWLNTPIGDNELTTPLHQLQNVLQAILTPLGILAQVVGGVFTFIGNAVADVNGPVYGLIQVLGNGGRIINTVYAELTRYKTVQSIFDSLYQTVRPLIQAFSTLASTVVYLVGDMFGLSSLGEDADGFAPGIQQGVRSFTNFITSAVKLLQKPIQIISAGINLVTGLVATVVTKVTGTVKKFITWFNDPRTLGTIIGKITLLRVQLLRVWNKIKAFFKPIIDAVSYVFDKIGEAINSFFELGDKVGDPFQSLKDDFKSFLTNTFGEQSVEKLRDVRDKLKGVWDSIQKWWNQNIQPSVNKVKNFVEAFSNADVSEAADPIDALVIRLKAGLNAFDPNAINNLKAWLNSVTEVWNKVVGWYEQVKAWYNDNLKPIVDKIQVFNALLMGGISGFFSGTTLKDTEGTTLAEQIEQRMGAFAPLKLWLKSNFSILKKQLIDYVTSFIDSTFGEGTTDNLKKKWQEIKDWWKTNIEPTIEKVKVFFKTFGVLFNSGLVTGDFRPLFSYLQYTARKLWNSFTATMSELWDNIKTFIAGKIDSTFGEGTTDKLKSAWENIKRWWEETKAALEPIITAIADFGAMLWNAILGFFSADVPDVDENGNELSLMDKLGKRLESFSTIGDWLSSKWKSVTDQIHNWLNGGIVDNIWNGLNSWVNGLYPGEEAEEAAKSAGEETKGFFDRLINWIIPSASAEDQAATASDLIGENGELVIELMGSADQFVSDASDAANAMAGDAAGSVPDGNKSIFSKIGDFFGGISDSLFGLKDDNPGALAKIIEVLLIAGMPLLLGAIGKIGLNLSSMGKYLAKGDQPSTLQTLSELILNLGKAFALIALSLVAISKFGDTKQMALGALIILGVMAGVAGITTAVEAAKKKWKLKFSIFKTIEELGTGIRNLARGLLGLAAVVLLLGSPLIATERWKTGKERMLELGEWVSNFVAALIVVSGIMDGIAGKISGGKGKDRSANFDKLGMLILEIVGSLLLVGFAVILFGLPILSEGLWETGSKRVFELGAALGIFIIAFVALLNAANLIPTGNGRKDTNFTQLGIFMLALAGALTLLLVPIVVLGALPKALVDQGIKSLGLVALILGGLGLVAILVSKFAGIGGIAELALLAVIAGAAAYGMTELVKSLASVDQTAIDKTITVLIAVGVALGVMMGLAALAGLGAAIILPGLLILAAVAVAIGLIVGLLSNVAASLAPVIFAFGNALSDFDTLTKNVDHDSVKESIKDLESIMSFLASVAGTGFNSSKFNVITDAMLKAGSTLALYNRMVSAISHDAIELSKKELEGLAGTLVALSGYEIDIATIESITGEILAVGADLALYNSDIAALDVEQILGSVEALNSIAAEMVILGSTDTGNVGAFGSQMSLLGSRLANFNTNVSGITAESISGAVAMSEDLKTIGTNLEVMANASEYPTIIANLGCGLAHTTE